MEQSAYGEVCAVPVVLAELIARAGLQLHGSGGCFRGGGRLRRDHAVSGK